MIEQISDLIRNSRYTVVLTGAGISTPSGIPDFRSTEGGLWNTTNPMEVASLSAFRVRPETFFSWFRPFSKVIVEAAPNPAHVALAKLEEAGHVKAIITQNIDGLHQRAGSKFVLEVHGTMNTLTCGGCHTQYPTNEFIKAFVEDGVIPLCPSCGGVLKPDAILFEEQLPVQTWQAVEKSVGECDLMIVVGSSLEVVPVARLPFDAVNRGAHLIIINNTPTYIDARADVVLHQDVVDALPSISHALLN